MLLVTGCFTTPTRPAETPDAPDTPDGSTISMVYRRTITITQPPGAPLPAFPVSVLIEDDAGLRDNSAGIAHIAFTTTDGVALPCEIVRATDTGTLEAWVLLPQLPSTPTIFELTYGADVTSPCAASSVWGDYRGVWHLSELVAGSARDSSSAGNTLTALDGGLPAPSSGTVGNGLRLEPADTDGADELCIENAPALQLDVQPFSYELWVNQQTYIGLYDIALWKGGSSAGSAGFDLELGQGAWTAFLRDAVDPDNRVELSPNSATLVNTWHHLAVTVDRSAGFIRAYLDGVLTGSATVVIDSVSGSAPLCLGSHNQPMQGWIDEVRVHSVARSREWFVTTYDNIAARSQFMTIGDER